MTAVPNESFGRYLVQHRSRGKNIEHGSEVHLISSFRLHALNARCQTIIEDRLFLPIVVIRLSKKP